MIDPELILRQLIMDGHVAGEGLIAAFGRWMRALNPEEAAAAPAKAKPAKRAVSAKRDANQGEMLLVSDGGQAKAPPMSDAERQAKLRARRKTVTFRDVNARQVIENIEESRNVTRNRDADTQAIDPIDEFAISRRDIVTDRGKKKSPHTPLRKTLPPKPPSHGAECVTVPWDSAVMPFLESIVGRLRGRYGSGRTVKRRDLDRAEQLMTEASTDPPFRATG